MLAEVCSSDLVDMGRLAATSTIMVTLNYLLQVCSNVHPWFGRFVA